MVSHHCIKSASKVIIWSMTKCGSVCVCCSRLGHKIQGVLCDGESNEVVASTVVNCLKIDEGMLTIQVSSSLHHKHNRYSHNFKTMLCLCPLFHLRYYHHSERRLCSCCQGSPDLWKGKEQDAVKICLIPSFSLSSIPLVPVFACFLSWSPGVRGS